MEQKITCCGDCPFMYTEFDDYAMGPDTSETCAYASFLRYNLNKDDQEYFIDSYNGGDDEREPKPTPDWCPLKKGPVTFKLEE